MLSEKNIYLLNLKTRPDRLLFTQIKMHRAGFDLSKINYIESVYAKEDEQCLRVFSKLPKVNRGGMCQPLKHLGALGLLKTYIKIIEDAKEKDLDYIAFVEDDNYFHPKLINKLRGCVKLLEDNDIIWVGSNQCMYLPEQVKKIRNNEDYKLGKGHIAGTFFIILSKKMYTHLYNFLSTEFEKNMYPIDVLLDLSLKNENMDAAILYPKPVLPEIRDSDNMGPRSHVPFYNSRGLQNFEDFDCFDLYDLAINHHYMSFTFEEYKEVYDKLSTYSVRLNKPTIGKLSVKTTQRFLESNYKSFHFIVSGKNPERTMQSIFKQDYLYWRVTYIDGKYENEQFKDKILCKEKYFKQIDNDEYVIFLNSKQEIHSPKLLMFLNDKYKQGMQSITSGYKNQDKFLCRKFESDDKKQFFSCKQILLKKNKIPSLSTLKNNVHINIPLISYFT